MDGENVTGADVRALRQRGIASVPAERMAYGLPLIPISEPTRPY